VERSYYLSLPLLLASMQGIQEVRVFRAQVRMAGQEYVVDLCVRSTSVLACEIKDSTGSVFRRGQSALDILAGLGMVEWYGVCSPTAEAEALPEQGIIPRPAHALSAERVPVRQRPHADLSMLDHTTRRVLLLVDGKRTIGHIAELLGKKSEHILDTMHILYRQGLITF
jgi:hypothetical protein